MKKYPEDVMKVYDLLLEYTDKVEDLIDRLQCENIKLSKKLMKIMESMSEEVKDEQNNVLVLEE